MNRLRRISAPAWIGGAIYALLLSFGFQAEHLGESRPIPAMLAALLLLVPLSLHLRRLFSLSLPRGAEALGMGLRGGGRATVASAVRLGPARAARMRGAAADAAR